MNEWNELKHEKNNNNKESTTMNEWMKEKEREKERERERAKGKKVKKSIIGIAKTKKLSCLNLKKFSI